MKLEVLVSAMHQKDHSLLKKMNIQSDAIVVNQCDRNEFEEFNYKGNLIRFLSLSERGVGLSRNNALMRSKGDICVFADDDVTYMENYKEVILKNFSDNPKADIILFNVESLNKDRPTCKIEKDHRVKLVNSLKYGAVNIAFRRESILSVNVSFSLLFGGGAKYSAGEDSLFICECLRKGLKIYASVDKIADVKQDDSTWFTGYSDKYFIDKGVFFKVLSKRFNKLLMFQFAIRKHHLYKANKSMREALKLMSYGAKKI